jgi:hypothetical protein
VRLVGLAQEAARKRREPSYEPGAWAGKALEVDVKKMVTQERWVKTQKKLDWIHQAAKGKRGGDIAAECPQDKIPHKTLESIRGFLVYVARTYTTLVPYLKGIHLTLDSWRANRGDDSWPIDDDGWQLANTIDDRIEDGIARQGGLEPPKFVKAAARLSDDLKMLRTLTETKEPARATEIAAGYMFGGASGGGCGTSLWMEEEA